MRSSAIVDTGPLIASINSADPDHRACLDTLSSTRHALILPAMCVTEATFLIGRKRGARIEAAFLRGLQDFDVQAPAVDEWDRVAELVSQYGDLPLGGTDASVIALAERHGTTTIITLDRKHFTVVRSREGKPFSLLP